MFNGNRISSFVFTIGICTWCAASVTAQSFHHHADCGYRPGLPIYSHGHLDSAFIQIVIEPVVPIWIAPTRGFGTLERNHVLPPREPFRWVPPAQVENFAHEGVAARGIEPRQMLDAGPRDAGPFDELDEVRRRVAVLKRSTPEGRLRADRLISTADAAFAKQSYARAVALYRDAIARAPDYAEGHFRLAHAYTATRRYNLALKSAMTALELSGTARRDGFSLEELYRGNQFAREQHDAILSDAILREPEDGGLQFLIGLTVHYSGNPLKAREHFRSAMRFPGAHQAYVRHFIPVVPVVESDELALDAK